MQVDCEILESGALRVTLAPEEREELQAQLADSNRGYWGAFADLFESYSCNGSFTPFDAGDGRPFVGLTDSPCIAECMDYADDGTPEIVGRLWWFPDYMIRDPLDQLARHGEATFTLAGES